MRTGCNGQGGESSWQRLATWLDLSLLQASTNSSASTLSQLALSLPVPHPSFCLLAMQVGGGQSGERVVGRGAAYAGAELRAGKAAIEGALRAKGSACPELLLRFFRLEA